MQSISIIYVKANCTFLPLCILIDSSIGHGCTIAILALALRRPSGHEIKTSFRAAIEAAGVVKQGLQ